MAERRLNRLGYQLAGDKALVPAVAVLKLNTELYPASANTYDSLGEILLLSGDGAGALAAYRRVLEALPGDGQAGPAVKEQLRRNAKAKVKELAP